MQIADMQMAGHLLRAQKLSDINRKIVKKPVENAGYYFNETEIPNINREIEVCTRDFCQKRAIIWGIADGVQ
ncbi:hypothetical protein OS493_022125 [Desmophyllum pertusum]|uniref:Uncharacterized protein n=1 Tax=Desmophyllum pertusum TaxID=174260 RepID=A0A9W9YMK4_9CNID|nr:hypothetical protein OS493_022125 [Desmophyllum pertusum]